jgi:MATE family multidrug resistance protein
MNTALETLVSHAFGAKQPQLCGEHLNRMRVILFVIFIPLCLLLTQCESLLLFLGQDPDVSRVAAEYIIFQLPGLFLFALFDANRLYLNSMEETKQGTAILLFGLPMHALICYYFVHI